MLGMVKVLFFLDLESRQMTQKRYTESILCYDTAISLDKDNIDAWNNKGKIYHISLGNTLYDLEKYQEAIVCYD